MLPPCFASTHKSDRRVFRHVLFLGLLWAMTVIGCPAQTVTTLHDFSNGQDGDNPAVGLVQATDGNLYGTTAFGGANAGGTALEITPGGTFKSLYSFGYEYIPSSTLVQASDRNLYGTTGFGGNEGAGQVFRMTPGGAVTTLYSFCSQPDCADGSGPNGGLIQASDGNLYGVTAAGGANSAGTVFRITLDGSLTTLYSFCSQANCADGSSPEAGIVQDSDGNFYGTTLENGADGGGTIYRITPSGTLTTLHSFCSQANCADGASPFAGLIQANDGNFYGTTYGGGANRNGTVFRITPGGTLTTLYSFCSQANCADGAGPRGGLIQATDGNLYGTTTYGGNVNYGTVFKITLDGTLTTLYSFCSEHDCRDGEYPLASLVQETNGDLYGTTEGSSETAPYGTIFSLSLGLGPFVEAQTNLGKVGAAIMILGNDLIGTTGVSFDGTPANFNVNANSYLTATVPNGATTGAITVAAPGGTLTSNQNFRVLPQFTSFSPSSGPVGTPVTITGVSLTQTTAVTFGGVAASFTVDSDTQVIAMVPVGARTGAIVITTLGGSRWSPTAFTVTP